MVWWFFKKRSEPDLSHLHKSLKNSFANVKADIEKAHAGINQVKGKHTHHEQRILELEKKMEYIEKHLGFSTVLPLDTLKEQASLLEEEKDEVHKEPKFPSIWESLTETEREICWKLSHLQKEYPNEWIPLKSLAREVYPDKEYSKIRSTISQFIANLEELGFVKRKRKGRQAYVFLVREKKSKKDKPLPMLTQE